MRTGMRTGNALGCLGMPGDAWVQNWRPKMLEMGQNLRSQRALMFDRSAKQLSVLKSLESVYCRIVENQQRYHSIPSSSFGTDPLLVCSLITSMNYGCFTNSFTNDIDITAHVTQEFQRGLSSASAVFASSPWRPIVAFGAAAPQRTGLRDRAISTGGAGAGSVTKGSEGFHSHRVIRFYGYGSKQGTRMDGW